LLIPHAEYLALGADPAARAAAYRALFAGALLDELVAEIRCHLQQQKVLGSYGSAHGRSTNASA